MSRAAMQAVWLLDTPEFRRAAFDSRRSTYGITRKTSDQERALANLLERDGLFTEDVGDEAAAWDMPVIHVDVGMSVDELPTPYQISPPGIGSVG